MTYLLRLGWGWFSGVQPLNRGQPVTEVIMGKPKPPVSFLWEKYSYNPITGFFHCRETDYRFGGNCSVRSNSHGLSLNSEHRYPYGVCVWAFLHGRWPEEGMVIDHINRNPFDHRPHNLREVTRAENNRNSRALQRKLGTGRHRTSFTVDSERLLWMDKDTFHSEYVSRGPRKPLSNRC